MIGEVKAARVRGGMVLVHSGKVDNGSDGSDMILQVFII